MDKIRKLVRITQVVVKVLSRFNRELITMIPCQGSDMKYPQNMQRFRGLISFIIYFSISHHML